MLPADVVYVKGVLESSSSSTAPEQLPDSQQNFAKGVPVKMSCDYTVVTARTHQLPGCQSKW